jgi:hypothetical protein
MSLAPMNENQHGLNGEENHTEKKIVYHLSASDVTRVVSLGTNNLKRKRL